MANILSEVMVRELESMKGGYTTRKKWPWKKPLTLGRQASAETRLNVNPRRGMKQ